jgi:hypothetical protein
MANVQPAAAPTSPCLSCAGAIKGTTHQTRLFQEFVARYVQSTVDGQVWEFSAGRSRYQDQAAVLSQVSDAHTVSMQVLLMNSTMELLGGQDTKHI